MTDKPPANLIWETALDWLLLIQENPHDADLARRLNDWRASAAEHDAAWRKAQKVWQLSGAALSLPSEPAAGTPQIEPRTFSPRHFSRRKRSWIGAAAAACVVMLLLPDWQALRADYHSHTAEHRDITLSDGSHMLLDSNSVVDVQFDPGQRQVTLLRGQAFFSVKSEPDRAFYVNAGPVRVRVTGTAFAVSVEQGEVHVSVESGTVAVKTPSSLASSSLHHGDHLNYSTLDNQTRVAQWPDEYIAPWRRWQLIAVDQSVDDVIQQLRRYQPGLIVLTDKALGQRRITAALNLRDPKRALQAAIAPLGGTVQDRLPFTLIVSDAP